MVYLEPITLGWRPLVKSWLQAFPEVYGEECRELTNTMFEWLVDPCLDFIRKNCRVRQGRTELTVFTKGCSDSVLYTVVTKGCSDSVLYTVFTKGCSDSVFFLQSSFCTGAVFPELSLGRLKSLFFFGVFTKAVLTVSFYRT